MIRQRLINFTWIFTEKFGVLAVSALSFFIFAMYLSPAQLGYGVLAIVIVESFGVFYCMMIEDPLVGEKEFTSSHAASAFWLGAIMVSATLALLTLLMWMFASESILWMLVGLASIKTVAAVASRPFIAAYRRRRNFKALAMRTLLSKLLGAFSGIVAAVMGAGAWAVVIQGVVLDVVACVILCSLDRDLLRGRVDSLLFCRIVQQGFPAAVKNSCQSLMARGAIMLVGITMSPVVVGYYSFASRLIELPLSAISNGLTSYSVPALGTRVKNGQNVGDFFIAITAITCCLILPALAIGSQYFAPYIVSLFGEKWQDATWIFLLLSMISGLRLFTLFVPGLMVVHGKSKVGVYLEVANTLISLGIFYLLSVYFEVIGSLIALTIFYCASFVIKVLVLNKTIAYPRIQFLYACFCVLFATIVAWLLFYFTQSYFHLDNLNSFFLLIAAMLVYAVLLLAINNKMAEYFKAVVVK